VLLQLTNDSTAPVALLGAGVQAPKTWADAMAFLDAADLSDPNLVIPDWIIQGNGGGVESPAGESATGFAILPAGESGVICGTGEWPALDFVDGGSFVVGE
jgi:hypothetical protein